MKYLIISLFLMGCSSGRVTSNCFESHYSADEDATHLAILLCNSGRVQILTNGWYFPVYYNCITPDKHIGVTVTVDYRCR